MNVCLAVALIMGIIYGDDTENPFSVVILLLGTSSVSLRVLMEKIYIKINI